MRKSLALLALCLTLCLALAASAFAGPTMDRIRKTKELRVGMSGDLPPLNALSKSGDIIGLDADLAQLLASSMGATLKIKTMPFERLIPALTSGQIDLIIAGMTMTPKRNMEVMFVGPYLLSGQTVLTTTDLIPTLKSGEDLNNPNMSIACTKGTTSENAARQLFGKAKITTTKTIEGAVKLLLEGKVKAVVTDYAFAAVTRFRNPGKNLASMEKPFTYEPLGIGVPGNDPLLANLVNNFIGVFQVSGELKKMERRWFERADWVKDLK